MSVLREIAAVFGFQVEGVEDLKKGHEEVEGLIEVAKKFGETVAEGFAWEKVSEFVDHQVEAATSLERTATILGVTTEKLEQYRYAAGDAGVKTEDLDAAFRTLARNVGQAAAGTAGDLSGLALKGGHAAKTLKALKIELTEGGKPREASEIFADLADKIQATVDPTTRLQIATDVLGKHGATLIPLLEKGRAGLEEAKEQLDLLGGTTSKEFIASSKKIEESQHRLSVGWGNLQQKVAAGIFPMFEKLIDWATKWVIIANQFAAKTTLMTTGLEFLAGVALVKTISSILKLIKTLGLLNAEFLVPIVGMALLYLAFDEFYGFLEGKDSVIGDTIDSLYGLGSGAETGAASAVLAKAAWQDFGEILEDVGKIIWNLVTGPITALLDAGESIGEIGYDVVHGDLKAAKAAFVEGGKNVGKDLLGNAADAAHDIYAGRSHFDDAQGAALAAGDAAKAKFLARHQYDQYGPANGKGRVDVGPITFGGSPGEVHVPAGSVRGAGGGEGGAGGIVVHQTNKFETTVHPGPGLNEKGVGQAVGQGLSTAVQRANNNAFTSRKRP
jgi:hypothetical protein